MSDTPDLSVPAWAAFASKRRRGRGRYPPFHCPDAPTEGKQKKKRPRDRRISALRGVSAVPERGLEPPRPVTATWPSTMRVYQFRHSGKSNLGLWNLDFGLLFQFVGCPIQTPTSPIHYRCDPGRIRTCDSRIKSPLLCQAELRGQAIVLAPLCMPPSCICSRPVQHFPLKCL